MTIFVIKEVIINQMELVKELQLDQLSEEETNKAYTFKELGDYYNNEFTMSKIGVYYPYNYFTKDVGMGCAWRAIQTLLSTHSIDQTFLTLYEKYSKKEALIKILQEKQTYKQEILQILVKKCWTPEQIQAHWAEPFIGSIACKANNLPHKLFVINGHPFSYAPSAVFQQILTFQQFYTLARTVIDHSSIMIDDGTYALSIIGINFNLQDQIEFLFGDPHIRSNRNQKSVGVYRKLFDMNGKSLGNQMTEIQSTESLYNVYEALEFETKKWMVCLILPREEIKELQLDQLSEEESNKAYSFKELSEYYSNEFTLSKTGVYYPYNHLTKDVGIGCAWRAIQTLLSTHGINETFLSLYEKYNKKEVLLKILQEKQAYPQEILQILAKQVWAPGERKSHSGQPYIASIACRANDIPHKFFGINGYEGCHAPPAIYQQIITFQQFYTYAKSVINHSSIMIDDGHYALSIIGINLNLEDKIELLFGDPHVRDNRTQKSVGVYRKTFDLNGKSIVGQMTEIQKTQRLYEVYEALQFDNKKWMVCLILS